MGRLLATWSTTARCPDGVCTLLCTCSIYCLKWVRLEMWKQMGFPCIFLNISELKVNCAGTMVEDCKTRFRFLWAGCFKISFGVWEDLPLETMFPFFVIIIREETHDQSPTSSEREQRERKEGSILLQIRSMSMSKPRQMTGNYELFEW